VYVGWIGVLILDRLSKLIIKFKYEYNFFFIFFNAIKNIVIKYLKCEKYFLNFLRQICFLTMIEFAKMIFRNDFAMCKV